MILADRQIHLRRDRVDIGRRMIRRRRINQTHRRRQRRRIRQHTRRRRIQRRRHRERHRPTRRHIHRRRDVTRTRHIITTRTTRPHARPAHTSEISRHHIIDAMSAHRRRTRIRHHDRIRERLPSTASVCPSDFVIDRSAVGVIDVNPSPHSPEIGSVTPDGTDTDAVFDTVPTADATTTASTVNVTEPPGARSTVVAMSPEPDTSSQTPANTVRAGPRRTGQLGRQRVSHRGIDRQPSRRRC